VITPKLRGLVLAYNVGMGSSTVDAAAAVYLRNFRLDVFKPI
jgi:hypothetical protein